MPTLAPLPVFVSYSASRQTEEIVGREMSPRQLAGAICRHPDVVERAIELRDTQTMWSAVIALNGRRVKLLMKGHRCCGLSSRFGEAADG